jgi:hypothetical protein
MHTPRVPCSRSQPRTCRLRTEFNVDLRVYFVKANGGTSPKVFRVRQLTRAWRASRPVEARLPATKTTRTHYVGKHDVDVVVNGATHARDWFIIVG